MTATPTTELDYRPSYRAAAIAAGLVLLLYLITLAPSTAMWDTSEYIAAAYTLGLPHPPGNPLFVLIGRVFAILPIAPNPSRCASTCSRRSAARCRPGLVPHHRARAGELVARALAAHRRRRAGGADRRHGVHGLEPGVVNEKVYTVSLVGVAVISWLTVRWCDDPDGRKADRMLVLVAYLLGLGYANHMAGLLAAPAVGVAVLVRRPQTLLRWKLLLACVGALASSASRRSRRSRSAPRTSRRSTKASRRRAARSSRGTARSAQET